jgi:hypothetical protein
MSEHPQSPPPPKASYEAPTLKRLGSITELTRGGFSPLDDFTLAGSVGD